MILVGMLFLCPKALSAAAAAAGVSNEAGADGELEIIPPPPGVTGTAKASTGTAGVVGLGGLVLPKDIQAPVTPADRLSAPSYLTAIASNRSVLLSWYQSDGPRPLSGYLIFRGRSPDSILPEPINRGTVTETNFSDSDANSDSGPLNRNTYYYKVRAFDVDGRLSAYSDVVEATPNGPLLPPGKVDAAGYDGKILLMWTPPISTGEGDLAGFRLLRGESSGKLSLYRELTPSATAFTDEATPNGKPFYYALVSVDSLGNTSGPSPEVRASAFSALSAPTGLSALGVGDQAVRLKWAAPPPGGTFKVKGYNVYRSTGGPIDLASPPVNKTLIPAVKTRFEDGIEDSVEPPKKGTDYHYEIVAVDAQGNPSPPSEESVAGPVASLTKVGIPEVDIAGNSLQISGRKTIDAAYTWVKNMNDTATGVNSGPLGGFQLDQQLQVRLTGKVGRKITVDVDYDDKAVDNQQQKISVVYAGDQQEVFKEFAFGDILMDLSSARTEFAGYNKSLFGAKLKLVSPDERLRITAVGAQTKGITETKRIVGGYEQAKTGNVLGEDKQDLSFYAYKYYYLSRERDLVEGSDYVIPGSVDIWLDQPGVTIYTAGRQEVLDKTGTGRFYFIRLVPNVDYTVDSSSGLVTFNHGIGSRDNIAVAYRIQKANGTQVSVGYDAAGAFDFTSGNFDSDKDSGKTTNSMKMIQYGAAYSNQYDSHMSMQYYKLNGRDILNPQLDPDFKLKISTPSQTVFELDPRSNFSNVVEFDTRLGWMRFRLPFPFKQGNTDFAMDPSFSRVETVFSPNLADAYSLGTNRANNYTIHIEYKYKVASYTLRYGIIHGSEVILLDGRRLARDVDYYLDYDTGSLVFSNPDLIKDTSVVDATYEYLPFGGQFTSTIWGTRGEYDITKDISVGSTFLWNSSDAPTDVPDVTSSPYSLQILDGDIQASVPQDLLDGLTRKLPLLPEHDGVLSIKASGEMAKSWFNPNTYARNNESGVAMIDNFEAIDNIVSTSTNRTSWFPASRPLRFTGDSGLPAVDRRFTRFITVQEAAHDAATRAANNENPNTSMAQIEWSNFNSNNNWDAYVYSFGQTTPDAIKSASYIEMWVKVDQPVTLHIDAGQIDEDATDNGILDTESSTGILGTDQDIGFYNDRSLGSSYSKDINNPAIYPDSNYWGKGNNVVDTEDLDGNGQLDRANNYYSFSTTLQGSSSFQLIQIPLTSATIIGSNLSVVPGDLLYYANVRSLRFWIQGDGASAGRLLIESIQFKGNKWQVRADSNLTTLGGVSVTADTSRFQVNAINRLNNASVAPNFTYVPNTDFYNKSTNSSDDREQSLQLEYALTRLEQDNGKPYYQARRQLSTTQDVDAGIYRNMRVDIYKPHDTLPGERLLLRLGTDDQNYFEYEVPLDSLSRGAWNTVTLALDGSDGKRSSLGTPYLRQVRFVTLAVHTLNDNLNSNPLLKDHKELLWINNLRLTDAISQEGGAQKVSVTYNLLDGALVVKHDIHDVDSDFVKMDQQAIAPQRHEQSQVVDATLSAIKGLPITARYEEHLNFTEAEHRDDPKYSRIFVDPDETVQRSSGTLSFTRLTGLNMNSSGYVEHARQIFLPAYIDGQRLLAIPGDQSLNPDLTRNDLHLSQDLTYTIPKNWWGIGSDQLKLDGAYDQNKVIFDQESVNPNSLAFKNVERQTRRAHGRYSGTYHAGDWLTVSPSYDYTLTEAEGNIPVPTVLQGSAYYQLDADGSSDGWIPQSRVINPALQIQLKDLGILRNPRATYNFTQTRDYVRNELRTPGSVDLGGSLNFTGLGDGWKKLPVIDVTQTFGVDSVINNDVRIRSDVRQTALDQWMAANPGFASRYGGVVDQNIPSLALEEQQGFTQSVWWVRLEDLGLGENVIDPLNIENLAVSSSRRSYTSFNTRFDLPLLPNWVGTFTPRANFRDERTMSAPEQVLRAYQVSLGSGVEFKEPHIPWWRTLKPSALTVDYSYTSLDNFVVVLVHEDLSNNSVSHTLNTTLPMRPTDKMTLTASLGWTSRADTYYLGGSSVPTSGQNSWELDPLLKLVYFLKVDRPWKLPDMWPFYGRELRIRQNFQFDNQFSVAIKHSSQSQSSNALADTGSNTYSLSNQLGYDVLDNVKMNLAVVQSYVDNLNAAEAVNLTGSYYSVTLKLGLEAIF